jgi:hypothetical protein
MIEWIAWDDLRIRNLEVGFLKNDVQLRHESNEDLNGEMNEGF